MAKYRGKIGFGLTKEKFIDGVGTGVWENDVVERYYRGDVIQNIRRWQNGDSLNDNLTIGNEFSIIADSFAIENAHKMIYLTYAGSTWKITNVTIDRPRMKLSLGGVYNGEQA